MIDVALILFGSAIAILGMAVFGGLPFHRPGELRKARARAEAQFRSFRALNPDGSPLITGATTRVLDQSASYTSYNGKVHDYVLKLFVLTEGGKHFLFMSNAAGNPYVSALTPERAKLVLKHKYEEGSAQ